MGPRANKINGANTQAVPCSATYALNTQVTLTATPDAGSSFSGWFGGGCSGVGTCQVTLNNAKVVMAMFSKPASGFTVSYYHTDRLGSVRAMTDASGALVGDRHDYAPFGEDTAPITGNPMRFGGKQLDGETALHYFEARYHRQTWGRFTLVDPGSGWTSDPQSWNRYAYARNNPLKYVDPTGLSYTATYDTGDSSATVVYFTADEDFWGWVSINQWKTYGGYYSGPLYDDLGRYHGQYEWEPGGPRYDPPTEPPPTTPGPEDPPTTPGPGPGPGPTCPSCSPAPPAPVPLPPAPPGPAGDPDPGSDPDPHPASISPKKQTRGQCAVNSAVNTAIGATPYLGTAAAIAGLEVTVVGPGSWVSLGNLSFFNRAEAASKGRARLVEDAFNRNSGAQVRAAAARSWGAERAREIVLSHESAVRSLRKAGTIFAIAGGVIDFVGCFR